MKLCKECGLEVGFIRAHILDVHQLTYEEYVLKHDHAGVRPTCECGCGEIVNWNNNHGKFNRFICKHQSAESKEKKRIMRLGNSLSKETREKMSLSLKEFYSSDEGKACAQARSEALVEFYSTEEGKTTIAERNEKLKEFYTTSQGIAARQSMIEKNNAYRKQHPEVSESVSKSLKEWYSSEDGQNFLKERSEKQRKFYSTDEGKQKLEIAAAKIRAKLLLTREKFESKINVINDVFEHIPTLPTYHEYDGIKTSFLGEFEFKCLLKGHVQRRKLINVINIPKCLICMYGQSAPQTEVAEFVSSLGVDICVNDRSVISPLEIDIYIPEFKLGIEYNGLYWHSNANDHVNFKHVLCREKGVQLLTIFEDEWRDKRDIVEQMIKYRLKMCKERVYARKLNLVELSSNARRGFFNQSHLEGDVKAKITFGLCDQESNILSAMSLRKPFHKSLSDYLEIARSATKPGLLVPGANSRLCKHCFEWAKKNGYKGLMTYVDTRHGNGDSYLRAGFRFDHETSPRFWWTDCVNRYNRFAFKANTNYTQDQVADNAGVRKIIGASNYVLVMD